MTTPAPRFDATAPPAADALAPLSIGLASPAWPRSRVPNGIVTYVSNLEGSLRALGHTVSILALNAEPEPSHLRVFHAEEERRRRSLPRRALERAVSLVSPQRGLRWSVRNAVTAAARRMHGVCALDVLEIEESFGMAAWLARALPIPICLRLHGPWFLTGALDGDASTPRFRERVHHEGLGLAAATVVSSPARHVLESVRRHYRLPLEHAEVIPNPISLAPPERRWSADACEKGRILFVGRFDRVKAPDLLIEAFAEVRRRVPSARLCLVGADGHIPLAPGRPAGLLDWVREKLPGALEAGQVEWLGVRTPAEIGPLRGRAAVTVVCSRYETFPYTVAEAMSFGCPVVAADAGGIPDLVRDGETGLLHRSGDAGDLAAKLVSMLDAPDRAAAMGARALRLAGEELAPGRVAARMIALYRRAIERFASRGGAR